MSIVYSIALKNVNRKASLLKGNVFTAQDAGLLIKNQCLHIIKGISFYLKS